MIRSIRGPLIALISTAFVVVLASRVGSTYWASQDVTEEVAGRLTRALWFNFLAELAVMTGVFFGVKWLVSRDRRDRFDQARREHFAEVAAMSGGFAHEARNLLNALQTRIELLRKNLGDNPKAAERVDFIEELATEMEQLFTDFLTLARPAEDDLEETNVASLITQVLEFEQLELERSGIRVNCSFDPKAAAGTG